MNPRVTGRTPRPRGTRRLRAALGALAAVAGLWHVAAGGQAAEPDPAEATYVGTVSGQPIVAAVSLRDGRLDGIRYHYRRFGWTVYVWPGPGPSQLHECDTRIGPVSAPCEDRPAAIWQVSRVGDSIRGTWRRVDGQGRGTVELVSSSQAYEDIRRGDEVWSTGPVQRQGELSWRESRESRTRLPRLEVTAGLPAPVASRLNDNLAAWQRDWLQSAYDDRADIRMSWRVVDGRFVVANGVATVWWSARMNHEAFTSTWSLRTGEPVDWVEAVRRVPAGAGTVDLDRSATIDAMALRGLRTMARQGDACAELVVAHKAQCRDNRCPAAAVADLSWQMEPTRRGLSVGPEFIPHPEQSCVGAVAVVIPWKDVERVRRPGATWPLP